MTKQEILRLARRHRLAALPVEDAQKRRQVVGYFRVVELYLQPGAQMPPPLPLVQLRASEPVLTAIVKLHHANQSLGHVIDAEGKTVGFVTSRNLTNALFRE